MVSPFSTLSVSIMVVLLVAGLAVGYFESSPRNPPVIANIQTSTTTITSTINEFYFEPTSTVETETINLVTTLVQSTVTFQNSTAEGLVADLQSELSLLKLGKNIGATFFALNTTLTIPGNQTWLYENNQYPHNGTLVFSFQNCPNTGISSVFHKPYHEYDVLLNASSNFGSGDDLIPIGASSDFSFSFENSGVSSISCTFSLGYIYDLGR